MIIGYDDRKASLLRSWVSDPGAVTFITDSSLYSTPAGAIASYWQLFERHVTAGATVWHQFPIWSRCLYDAGTAAPQVLDIAERTHPRIVLPSGLYQPAAGTRTRRCSSRCIPIPIRSSARHPPWC